MKEASETALKSYLTSVAGDLPWLEPVDKHDTIKLPLFLRQRYRIFRADLFGRKCYLALEESRDSERSPTEYTHDATSLKQFLSGDVVLVLSKVSSYVRNRLVRQHVPFIVPGTQMFLPMLMIDLREQYPVTRIKSEKLTPIAQLIIIYHLMREPLNNIPLGQIASRLGYSAMAVSQAQEELRNAQLSKVVRFGRTLSINFNWTGRALWDNAKPLLSSPVKRMHWIRWGRHRPHAVASGITAMSKYTMLADESIPTFAMNGKDVVEALTKGEIVGCPDREDAEGRLEAWKYDPRIVAKNDTVDPFSLYLTLQHSADERVQKELEVLINGFLT